jgi:pimeloyl-ACP methyl ester carboxylesterase
VFRIADAEGLNRFAIWGHSYGGWIAWMTATANPAWVAAIVTSGAGVGAAHCCAPTWGFAELWQLVPV